MTWSFSRLNAFYNCAYEFYLHYIECNKSENGFFGEYGSLIHKILEKYEKGELSLFELNEYYEEHYLNNIDLDLEKYEILGVEKKVEFKINDKNFVGYIDLLVKDKETGEIIIIDHKSASIKILKSGKISKSDQQHFLEFKRQLYLYSIPVIKEYGSVSKLKWNMFKDQKWIEIPWVQEEYEEAIQWAKDTLELIENEKEWRPNPDYYYCNYLCGQRNHACEYKPQPTRKKNEENIRSYNPETDSYE